MPAMRTRVAELSVDSLMEHAAQRVGSDDWGDRGFETALELLLAGCRERDALTDLGWRVMRSAALRHLRNRLLVRAFAAARPDVEQRPLSGAIVITGLPRTGTTVLQNLLALDADNRFLALWEALRPVPPQDAAEREALIERTRDWLEQFYALVPSFRAIHALTAWGPEECDALLQNSFASQHFDDMFDAPAYSRWLSDAPLSAAYAHYALALRVLAARDPTPRTWVLKSPSHVAHLDALLDVLDGALVVHCHRPPLAAVTSYASLIATLRGAYERDLSAHRVGRQALERSATATARALAVRATRGSDAFVDVSLREIVSDPIAVVRAVYRRAGRATTQPFERRMRRWLDDNPVDKHGTHRPDAAAFGLTEEAVTDAFAPYHQQFADLVGVS
jgi:hypothetical protein